MMHLSILIADCFTNQTFPSNAYRLTFFILLDMLRYCFYHFNILMTVICLDLHVESFQVDANVMKCKAASRRCQFGRKQLRVKGLLYQTIDSLVYSMSGVLEFE